MSSKLDMQAVILLNMKSLRERLSWALTRKGMSQSELARQVDVTRGAVSLWLRGGEMSAQNCAAVALTLDVDTEWLATGKGSPERKRADTGASAPSGHSVVTPLDKKTGIVTIFRYDTGGSMGGGIVLHDQPGVIESWQVSKGWLSENVRGYTSVDNLAIVTGFGDSMRPTYNPGDPLIVDKGVTTVEFDSVYFFRIDDVGYVKRLQRIPTPNGLIIKALSDNRDLYEPFEIREGMNFEVLARVVQIWRREDY